MMEFIEYVTSGFWVFMGFWIIALLTLNFIIKMTKVVAWRNRDYIFENERLTKENKSLKEKLEAE